MSNPRQPAGQLFYGPLRARSYVDRNLAKIGSVSPITKETMMLQHGRYLSGLGSEDTSGAVGYDPRYQGQHIYELEQQDDVYGSGIFDPKGRAGTANPSTGVFASHDSLPGYIAREVPFTVSQDVTDVTDDAEVVMVPGGGMAYIESRGKLTGPAVLGPTYRPPQIQPAGATRHDQVYAFMNRPGQRGTVLNPNAPERSAPTYRPKRAFEQHPVRDVPTEPRGMIDVPFNHPQNRLPYQSQVSPFVPTAPVHAANWSVAPSAPDLPREPQVPLRSMVNVGPTRGVPIAMDGLGAEEEKKEPASPMQLAIAGVLAGAAVGLVIHVTRK